MDNWWDILGVEQDADLRSIKRAYAAKLKTIRQDEDSQGFMKVREAYDIAKYSVGMKQSEVFAPTENLDSDSIYLSDFDPPSKGEAYTITDDEIFKVGEPLAADAKEKDNTELVGTLLQQAKDTIQDKEKRDKIEAWKHIFEQLHGLDVDEYAHFERSFQYLLGHNAHRIVTEGTRCNRKGHRIRPTVMRSATGRYIFDHFSWNSLQHPDVYSEDMKGLRNLLNAHSESTKKAMAEEARERQKNHPQSDDKMGVGTIIFLVFLGINGLRILFNILGIET